MAAYRFSPAERYAVFTVHREVCWLCGEPLALGAMEVDHIVPEHLEGKPELDTIKEELGLPTSFCINSFENWKPAHARCNRDKGKHVFRLSPMIQLHLEQAAAKVSKAVELRETYATDRKIDRALELLFSAAKNHILSAEQAARMKEAAAIHDGNRAPEDRGKPFRLAPWLTILGEGINGYVMQGPTGLIGGRPKGDHIDSSFDCPRCGPTAWNGARCVVCGMLNDE